MATTQGIRAGRAFVELYANDNKLVRGLRSAQRKLKRFGATITSIGARVAGFGIAAAASFAYPIKAASDMEETMNKFNVVFGENSKLVKEWSDGFAKDVGRSKQQVADFMAGSQDLFVPLGFEPGAATEMSKQITGLAVDLASFNNMADEDVIRDLQAALTGSGEVMKKYGVLVSEAAVKQELLRTGMDPKTATDQQKVMARLSIIMRGTTAAQGDALRSAGSYANQMKRLGAVINDTSVDIGNALLPAVTSFVKHLADAVEIAGKWIGENQELVKIIGIVTAATVAGGVALIAIGSAAAVASFAIGGLISMVSLAATVIGAILSPIGLVVTAVLGAAAAFLYFSGIGGKVVAFLKAKFEELRQRTGHVFNAIKDSMMSGDFSKAGEILWKSLEIVWQTGINNLNSYISEWKTFFLDVWYGTIDQASKYMINAWAGLQDAWTNLTQFFGDTWDIVMGGIQKVWSKVGGGIINGIGHIMKALNPMMSMREMGEFRVRAKEATGVGLSNEQINQSTSESIAERARQADAERRARSGAGSVVDEMAQDRRDARQIALDESQRTADERLNKAKEDLARLIAESPQPSPAQEDEKKKEQEDEKKKEQEDKLRDLPNTINGTLASRASMGELSTQNGLRSIIEAFNKSGQDKTIDEIRTSNTLLAEAVDLLRKPKPRTTGAS